MLFFQSCKTFWSGIYTPWGYGSFYLDDTENPTLDYEYTNSQSIFCGTAVKGEFYAYEYIYENYPNPSHFTSLNLYTGERKEIGYSANVQGLAYDYSSDTMYAIYFELGVTYLCTVDMSNGGLTRVIELDNTFGALAADYDGTLYGVDVDGRLRRINKTSGRTRIICDLGNTLGAPLMAAMAFDYTDNQLYVSYLPVSGSFDSELFRINMNTVGDLKDEAIMHLGRIGDEGNVRALYIPFVKDGYDAPAAPTNVNVAADPNLALKATITWTNPTTTFGGDELSSLKSITIIRGDEVLATIDATEPGKEMSWEDTTVPADGEYRYTIYATNEVGDGEEALFFGYVGNDYPAEVENLVGTVGDACTSIEFKWDAPAKGKHGNYYNSETLSYKIVRCPDEKVIAEDITETSFTDNSHPRLGRYYYQIYAKNNFGESYTTTDSHVLGKAVEIPFIEDFTAQSQDIFMNKWSAYDANSDSQTWLFNQSWDTYTFGSDELGADYIINPTLTDFELVDDYADEWLITPPINFVDGEEYEIVIKARSTCDNTLEITMSSNNMYESQEVAGTLTIPAYEYTEGMSFVELETFRMKLPAKYGINCVGLHLNTKHEYTSSHFQISEITVQVYDPSSVETINAASKNYIAQSAGKILVGGQFDAVEVYNIAGSKVLATTDSEIQLPKGLYIVNVKSAGTATPFKVLVK